MKYAFLLACVAVLVLGICSGCERSEFKGGPGGIALNSSSPPMWIIDGLNDDGTLTVREARENSTWRRVPLRCTRIVDVRTAQRLIQDEWTGTCVVLQLDAGRPLGEDLEFYVFQGQRMLNEQLIQSGLATYEQGVRPARYAERLGRK